MRIETRLCKNTQHLMSSVAECLQSAVKREGDATDVKCGTVTAFPRCVAGIKFKILFYCHNFITFMQLYNFFVWFFIYYLASHFFSRVQLKDKLR